MKKREIDSQSPSERGYEDVFHVYKQIKSLENGDYERVLKSPLWTSNNAIYMKTGTMKEYERAPFEHQIMLFICKKTRNLLGTTEYKGMKPLFLEQIVWILSFIEQIVWILTDFYITLTPKTHQHPQHLPFLGQKW